MKLPSGLDRRPIIVVLAGPNGAGKSTFYHSHLESVGLRYINADTLALELGVDAYSAAKIAEALRLELVKREESFVFETVFSDPVGDKLNFLKDAAKAGYSVVLCFIGLETPSLSEERVAMRVSQGGHDVPTDKLKARYPRILKNLKAAIRDLPHVIIYDNSDLLHPFRRIAEFSRGQRTYRCKVVPGWLKTFGRMI